MLKIAIVGNIASGKTTVEEILKSKGFEVYDTDKIAHEILATNDDIKLTFGTSDRKELANIVFTDSRKLKQLESIIHPLVKTELEKIFKKNEDIIFVSVPQLFEAGFEHLFDKIIYITANEDIRLKRLIKRNSYSQKEALIRINAQKEDNKAQKSNFVIKNNGSVDDLEISVEKILKQLS